MTSTFCDEGYHYGMKIVVTGAGGAPTEGVVRSLLESDLNLEIIGVGADKGDLALSRAHRKYLVPYANDENYEQELFKIIELEHPIFIHAQNDNEVLKTLGKTGCKDISSSA